MKNQTLINYLKKKSIKVNQAQAEAIADMNTVSIVEAGPGSGKSLTIIGKSLWVSYLDPSARVLCLSFSKKAVNDLQKRLIDCGSNAIAMTFHSYMLRLLKTYDAGYRYFKIIENSSVKRAMINQAITIAHIDKEVTTDMLAEALAKGKANTEDLAKGINEYLQLCKEKRIFCFDSIPFLLLELLECNKAICNSIRSHSDILLLDEVQDNSAIFFNIISKIFLEDPKSQCRIMLAGNVDQSIYSFRGADVEAYKNLIVKFNASSHTLNLCYRSVPSITNIFNSICPSGNQLKAVRKDNGLNPVFYAAENPEKEAQFIINEIQRLHSEGIKYNDMAILFRSSPAISTLFKDMLKAKLPVVRIGADPAYYSNSHVKSLLALLSILYDNHTSLYYSCVMPILGAPKAFAEYIDNNKDGEKSIKDIILNIPSISRSQKKRIKDFFDIDIHNLTLHQVVLKLWQEYLKNYFEATDDSIYNQYLDVIGDNTTFIDLRNEIMEYHKQINHMRKLETSGDYVHLMSIHSSKALEFNTVFLVEANEGQLPCTNKEEVNIDEEARLCYVAISRAMDRLYVTYPKISITGSAQEPSRFLSKFFSN